MRQICVNHQERPTKEACKDQKRPDQDVMSVMTTVHAPNMCKSSKQTYMLYTSQETYKRGLCISKETKRGRCVWCDDGSQCMCQICVNYQKRRTYPYIRPKKLTKEAYTYQKRPEEGIVCDVMSERTRKICDKSSKETYMTDTSKETYKRGL